MPDTNAILDVVDTIYNEDDLANAAKVLEDVKNFPNNKKQAQDIAREGLEAAVFKPRERIFGSPRERLLLMEISNAVKKRLEAPTSIQGRRNVVNDLFKMTKQMHILVSKSLITNTKSLKKKSYLRTKKETTSDEDKYTNYVKNETIMKRVRSRMRYYKKKMKELKAKERKKKVKRGPTSTTTTTTTTTVRPPMHKSKYYMRKYVKRNLYKMKITQIKTTTFRWRFYGKIRKFNIDSERSSCQDKSRVTNASTECSSSDSNETSAIKGYYSESDSNYEDPINSTTMRYSSDENVVESIKYRFGSDNRQSKKRYKHFKRDHKGYISTQYSSNKNSFKSSKFKSQNHFWSKFKLTTTPTQIRYPDYKTFKGITKYYNKFNNNYKKFNSKHETKRYMKTKMDDEMSINSNKSLSIDSNDDETILKANLDDVLFHTDKVQDSKGKRRFLEVHKLRQVDSISDEEALLKGRIYKVFGYSNNFARHLRTIT